MPKKKKTARARPQKAGPRRRRARHTEWLWIAAAFIIMGGIMVCARSGTVRSVPDGTPGAARGAALVNASDMRVYGWFNIIIGLSAVGAYVWMRNRPPEDDATAGDDLA